MYHRPPGLCLVVAHHSIHMYFRGMIHEREV